ncbi:MAG TPA: TetR/AcrR family transcriptional regulator C-terminal domain-containing protein [Candidatus Dormibacteraeota bacterium]|nr:TetR/AcrR family transcriptional regulator C-terminal domain-containing protein [Candidatus Dormibacteraeota bacterium]
MLSRARILAAALVLVDQDGLDALTMRRLADHLEVDPMSIYNYINGKEALLDGLAEQLWREVPLPDRAKGWKTVLRAYAISIRDIARRHPLAYSLLLSRGILPGPALELIDNSLHTLETAGLKRPKAAEMMRTLHAYAAGYATLELTCAPAAGSTQLEQIVNLTRALPADAPTRLVEVAQLMADCDTDYQFKLGLDLILTGLEARVSIAHQE